MSTTAAGSVTTIITSNPCAIDEAARDMVSDRFDPPVVRSDSLALAPPVAAAAREIRRNWTAEDRIARSAWAFSRSAEPLAASTLGVPADIAAGTLG